MPRVDRGSVAVDTSVIMRLSKDKLSRLIEMARDLGAVLVTSPSIVSVETGLGSKKIVLGTGSLVFEPAYREDIGVIGVRYWILAAHEWVDGCTLIATDGGRNGLVTRYGEGNILRGRLIPGDLRDPIALFLAGAEGQAKGYSRENPPIASIGLDSVVWFENNSVATSLTECEAYERLEYIVPLVYACK